MVKFGFGENWPLVIVVSVITYLGGCTNQPTNAQLEVWRKEAIARNAEIVADNAKNTEPSEWSLLIQGETATGESVELNWQQLQALATHHVKTPDPHDVVNPNQIVDFRGIKVSQLLEEFAITNNISEITFVSFNSYYVTVSLPDLFKYPMTLAIAKDGQPIPRHQGGPLYLVLPFTEYPELQQKYNEATWAYYVSHVVVGTEPVRLRVGKQQLDLAALDKLPQITLNEPVGYRFSWPSGEVKLHGVRLRDVLALAGENLPPNKEIMIRAKPPIYHDTANAVRLAVSEVLECDVILATRWGDNRQLIPAKMGGPVTLAFSSECPTTTKQTPWLTFVEELNTAP
ncbi:molybdopterin-dependent oxidoreductase [Anabaena sp. CCY 0017]|uniref:molybdopterin-dependent oxidoreductase n=1 Tax=Anabaena sp. CCY 0017 TaxID=3103866 RepID=UPI0039C5EBAC